MYRVLCDDEPIFDPRDENLVLIDPKLELEVNKPGSFSFKMPPQHPQYDLPQKMTSVIQVLQDDEEIFRGRIVESIVDFYNRKYYSCEGQLAYLNDSIQRPAEYHNMTVRGYLETLVAYHNAQVDKYKQFTVGIVTVTDSNDSLYRYTNYNSTMEEIKDDLVDDLGGYLRIRNVDGVHYLDYIEEYDNTNTQSIEFGENLLDFSRNMDVTDIATVIIPLGEKLEESSIEALEERLTIKDVNDGKDYLENTDAIKLYGRIEQVVTWDNVTTAEGLLRKAKQYLTDYQFDSMTLEVKAVDLHYTDSEIERFKLGDSILVHSAVHNLNKYFPLSKMTINLTKPSSNTFTLGTDVNTKLTASTNKISATASSAVETIPVPSAIVKQATDQATALIKAATHGHVVTTADEQLIMDTNDTTTASKVWRWNLNGLAYSNTGYDGTYSTAITMDGQILGDKLVGNSVSADKLSISYKNQVTQEISLAADNAYMDAENYTDDQLQSYYTKSEIETTIQNTKDSILLSAKETATQYVDDKLENYSTSAQIKVTTDAISSEVAKKTTSSDVESIIEQKADSIRLQATKISWSSAYSSMTEDGKLTCTSVSLSGDITLTKTIDTVKFSSDIGEASAKYLGADVTRGGLCVGSSRTGYSDKYGYGKIALLPASAGVITGSHEDSTHILYADHPLLIESHGDKAGATNYQNNWSAISLDSHDIHFLFGKSSADDGALSLVAEVDTKTGEIEEVRSYMYGTWYLPPVLRGGVSATTTSAANVWMGSYSGADALARVTSSSKRYKEIGNRLSKDDVEGLYNIDVVWAKYKNEYLSETDERYGKEFPMFIAENVEEHAPLAVDHNEDGSAENWNYRVMIPYMFQMIKELKKEIANEK